LTLSAGLWGAACSKSKSGDDSLAKDPSADVPELAMEKTKIQSFGPEGLEWVLVTPTAQGFSVQNKMHAQNLLITFYRNGRKATDLTADEGTIKFDDKKVVVSTLTVKGEEKGGPGPGDLYLTGNVVAVSTDGSKMYTDWLRYEKLTGLITSTAPVRVIRDDSTTEGVGLQATADLSSVKIFNQTVTIKERPKRK
jgi:lipopolysaccharide export system protein LptC